MEPLNIETQLVQSLLHMIVNSGESKDYPEKVKNELKELAQAYFNNNHDAAMRYIMAQLTIEVYENVDSYFQLTFEESIASVPPLERASNLIGEFHRTLIGFLNTKINESNL